jgi:tryptophan synthase beta chain
MSNDIRVVPTHWCNLIYDYPDLYRNMMVRPEKSLFLTEQNNKTFPKQPLSLLRQSHNLVDKDILIPEQVRELYLTYRPTPFKRAINLEKALGTKAEIYYKYEGCNISGSHKLNTAIAQAYYFKRSGIKHLITGTGAGQWGTAFSYACNLFDLKCTIFMVKVSLEQKPQRKALMELFNATVYESPSSITDVGLKAKQDNPLTHGSLAIATGEAIELITKLGDAQFAVGSGENNVLLHQTVIGNEVLNQMELLNIFPDKVYACVGAGSNFSGITFPLLRYAKNNNKNCEFIAVEPIACPKLTKGIYAVDVNDFSGTTPYSKMYTLGSKYITPPIHAGGLRYHGTSEFVSALYDYKYIKACAISQRSSLQAGLLFANHEGILPAPESAYAVAAAIEDIAKNPEEPIKIIINISGHGLFDIRAYEEFQKNILENDEPSLLDIEVSLENLGESNGINIKNICEISCE